MLDLEVLGEREEKAEMVVIGDKQGSRDPLEILEILDLPEIVIVDLVDLVDLQDLLVEALDII